MNGTGTRVGRRGGAVLASALMLSLVLGGVLSTQAAAAGQYVVIAQQRGVAFAGGTMLVRLTDVQQPAGGAPITHAHSPGFTYAFVGPQVLTVGGRRIPLAPGQAAWSGDQEEHSHERGSDAAGRFLFFGISPASARGGPSGGTVRDTEDLVLGAGVYDVVLSEARLPTAGDTITLPVRAGSTGLWLVEGQANLGSQALSLEGAALVRPGTPATLSTAVGGTRVFALTLSPAGATQLPRTGGAAPSRPITSAVLACAAGLLAAAWTARRRAPYPHR